MDVEINIIFVSFSICDHINSAGVYPAHTSDMDDVRIYHHALN
jgi:hypothetical protein